LPFILLFLSFYFSLFNQSQFCGRKITENLADIEIYFGLFLFLTVKSSKFAQKLWF